MFIEWHHENNWPRTRVKLISGTKLHHREDKLIPAKQDVLHEFTFTGWHRQLHTSSVFSREKSTVQLHSALKLHPDKARSSQDMSCRTRWEWTLIFDRQRATNAAPHSNDQIDRNIWCNLWNDLWCYRWMGIFKALLICRRVATSSFR